MAKPGPAVEKLSAEMALKAQVAAASRDFICEPHVGEGVLTWGELWQMGVFLISRAHIPEQA